MWAGHLLWHDGFQFINRWLSGVRSVIKETPQEKIHGIEVGECEVHQMTAFRLACSPALLISIPRRLLNVGFLKEQTVGTVEHQRLMS